MLANIGQIISIYANLVKRERGGIALQGFTWQAVQANSARIALK
jgi:hypothetical protein